MEDKQSDIAVSGRHAFLRSFLREVRVIAHSPFYLLFNSLLPLATFILFCAVFYQEIPHDLPVVVCDQDGSSLSRKFARMADATSSLRVVATVQDPAQGNAMIRLGKAYASFLVPAGLELDIKRGERPAIVAFYNNAYLLASGLVSRAAKEVISTLSAGLDLRTRMMKGESPAQAIESCEPVRIDAHVLFNPNLNYRYLLLPSVLPSVLQAFILMTVVRSLGGELKHGTAGTWMKQSGGHVWAAVLGKLAPHTACFIVMMAFMLALLIRVAGIPMYGSLWLVFGASTLFVLAYESLGLALVALTSNLRLANSIAGFIAGPAFAFAGITFPTVGMPLPARIWHNALPLSHYLHIFLDQALRGAPIYASRYALLALLLFTVLPPVLFMPRLARQMRDPVFWGRI